MTEEIATELDYARRLERGLVRVRWFGIVLGTFLITQTNTGFPPHASRTVLALAAGLLFALAVGNTAISVATDRVRTIEDFRRLGLLAFALDVVAIFSVAWIYSYDPKNATWVVIFILPLEGALRYRLRGALFVVAATLVNEIGREAYLAARFSHAIPSEFIPKYEFLVANIAFRVGVQALIASVAGFMSRSLARQRDRASEQAARFEDVARREAAARRELAAFNTAILTGVAAEDLDRSIQAMAEAIGPNLGYESFTILLREDSDLYVKGMYGMPFYDRGIPIGQGVTGTVASTGRPLLVPDVRAFPGYVEADPEMRSEMTAPMRIGEEVIGVVDVQSREPSAFDPPALDLLTRLADQIALVAHSNRLLSQQRETMRRLRELDEMKSDFVAITSHELRTPITAIRGFIKTLVRNRDRLSADQVANFLTIVDKQSERLARLVEDLLLVSRIEAGTLRLEMEEIDLTGFLKDLADSLGPDRRSRVWLEVDPPAPRVVVDPHRLDQILRNLVENALKFSPQDSQVFVGARVHDERIDLSVTDQGPGITKKDLPRIFERFHQAGHAMTREAEGAGLGLYITKRLVEAMGGEIEVTSRMGKGSTFRVRVPTRSKIEEQPPAGAFETPLPARPAGSGH